MFYLLNTFFPNSQTVEISRRYTHLHADYADTIVAAMEASVKDGTPVNPPIWWLDPNDQDALAVNDGKINYTRDG